MKHRTVTVTEFRANFLSLLDEIGQNGARVTITKRGRPLATVVPPRQPKFKSPEGSWAGRAEISDDLHKIDFADLFDCVKPDGETC